MRNAFLAAALTVASLSQTACVTTRAPTAARREFAALADRVASEKKFNGMLLVADTDGTILEKGYGSAVFEAAIPSSAATRYQTGSFSKWVASVVVLSLVDRGVLQLDTPIGHYLPAYSGPGKATVTLHHLLSHTSGIPNDLAAALRNDPVLASYAAITPDQAVDRFASGRPVFTPGAKFDYAHSNWLLVRAIIEHATGKSYARNVDEILLKPLALENSGIMPADFDGMPNAARGYVTLEPRPERAPRDRSFPIPDLMAAVGGFYSTADDLRTLLVGVYRGSVLSAESKARLWTVVTADEGYAYGGRVREVGERGAVRRASWNNNSNGPYKSLMVHTDGGTTVVLLNNTRIAGDDLAEIAETLLAAER